MATRFGRAWTSTRQWPGMRSEYSWIPPGAPPTMTRPGQVGVSFSGHRAVVYESASRTFETDLAPGSVIVTGQDPISWLHVREATEAVEIYPDGQLLASVAPGAEMEPAAAGRDGTVLAIASILKRAHLTGSTLSDIEASTLAHKLAGHVVGRYGGAPSNTRNAIGRLDRATVDRVTAFVDAELSEVLTLDRLAAVAALSPFYFARAFKKTTGMAPHQFVTARRMHRATTLLVGSAASVEQVSHAVGLFNVSYFRRKFRDHMGVLPGALRQDSKIGASAARSGLRRSRRADTSPPDAR